MRSTVLTVIWVPAGIGEDSAASDIVTIINVRMPARPKTLIFIRTAYRSKRRAGKYNFQGLFEGTLTAAAWRQSRCFGFFGSPCPTIRLTQRAIRLRSFAMAAVPSDLFRTFLPRWRMRDIPYASKKDLKRVRTKPRRKRRREKVLLQCVSARPG